MKRRRRLYAKSDPRNLNYCDRNRRWKYPTRERALAAITSHWGNADKQAERAYRHRDCGAWHVTSAPFRPSKHYCYQAGRWKFANRSEAEIAAYEIERDPADATRCKMCGQLHFEPELEPITVPSSEINDDGKEADRRE